MGPQGGTTLQLVENPWQALDLPGGRPLDLEVSLAATQVPLGFGTQSSGLSAHGKVLGGAREELGAMAGEDAVSSLSTLVGVGAPERKQGRNNRTGLSLEGRRGAQPALWSL